MRYVTAFRRFTLVAFLWWTGYRVVTMLDFRAETDRAIRAAQVQVAAMALSKGNI